MRHYDQLDDLFSEYHNPIHPKVSSRGQLSLRRLIEEVRSDGRSFLHSSHERLHALGCVRLCKSTGSLSAKLCDSSPTMTCQAESVQRPYPACAAHSM